MVALRARSAAAANCTGGSAQLALLADLLMLAGARCRLPNPASSMDHVARYIAEARTRPKRVQKKQKNYRKPRLWAGDFEGNNGNRTRDLAHPKRESYH